MKTDEWVDAKARMKVEDRKALGFAIIAARNGWTLQQALDTFEDEYALEAANNFGTGEGT